MESRLIIMESTANLRARGRAALSGHWKETVLAVLLFDIFMNFIPQMLDSILGLNVGWIMMLAVFGPLNLGLCIFLLNLYRSQDASPSDVLRGFETFGKSFVLGLLIVVFVVLWGLLLIVPGIIAYLRYSQAFFVLRDHPEYTAMECIAESKRMMDGNKARLFTLYLTFIGWWLLALLPAMVYGIVVSIAAISTLDFSDPYSLPTYTYSTVDLLLITVLGAGSYFISAYVNSSRTAFYELLRGNLSGQVFAPDQY